MLHRYFWKMIAQNVSIAEMTTAGTNIGDPISATLIANEEILTYSLGGTDAAHRLILMTLQWATQNKVSSGL